MRSVPTPLIAALALALALILVASHGPLGLVIQFLLGKLSYSTSNGSTLYMLGMCLLALASLSLRPLPGRLSHFALLAVPILLLIGFLGHGLATAYYLSHFDLPFGPYFLHWRDGGNSYTSPFHSHIGKVAIDFMAELIGVGSSAGYYDTGGVFREALNDAWSASLALAFLLGSLAVLMALPELRKSYPDQPALTWLYLGCAVAALKNVLDGGLLAQPALVSLIMVTALTSAKDSHGLLRLWKKYWLLGLLLILATLVPMIWVSTADPIPNLTELLVAAAIIGLVLLASFKTKPGKPFWLMAMYLLAAIANDARLNIWPLLQPLNPGGQVFRSDTAAVQAISAKVNVLQLYQDLGDSAIKSRWLLVADRQRQGSRELVYFIYPLKIAGQAGRFDVPAAFEQLHMQPVPKQQGWFALYARIKAELPPAHVDGIADVLSRNNAYVYTHALARMLTQSGFSEFIMMPGTGSNPIPADFLVPPGK